MKIEFQNLFLYVVDNVFKSFFHEIFQPNVDLIENKYNTALISKHYVYKGIFYYVKIAVKNVRL